jgi:hypothetical protein
VALLQLDMTMHQKSFLTIAAGVALTVGTVAVLFPATLLASKGTVPSTAADVWMREVGVLLVSLGVIFWSVRHHVDSPTMRMLMLGNMLVQLGLLATETLAFAQGVITQLSGLVPNATLHVVLAAGFAYFWRRSDRKN